MYLTNIAKTRTKFVKSFLCLTNLWELNIWGIWKICILLNQWELETHNLLYQWDSDTQIQPIRASDTDFTVLYQPMRVKDTDCTVLYQPIRERDIPGGLLHQPTGTQTVPCITNQSQQGTFVVLCCINQWQSGTQTVLCFSSKCYIINHSELSGSFPTKYQNISPIL